MRLGNHRGMVELTAQLFDGMQQGVLIAEGVHPNKAHGGGQGINTLIGSDQVPPFGGVAFHDAAVWIEGSCLSLRNRSSRRNTSSARRRR